MGSVPKLALFLLLLIRVLEERYEDVEEDEQEEEEDVEQESNNSHWAFLVRGKVPGGGPLRRCCGRGGPARGIPSEKESALGFTI